MNRRPWLFTLIGGILLVLALGFSIWTVGHQAKHVLYVTSIAKDDVALDSNSPTGYENSLRRLIVPGHNEASYRWIEQTQRMLARGEWRIRHVDNANAPMGHDISVTSPYRWWLGLVAWIDHTLSDRSLGLSTERAALWADPAIQWVLIVVAALFIGRYFGLWPAALVTCAIVTVYPWTTNFLPGLPDRQGLALTCVFWSVLLLLPAFGSGFKNKTPETETSAAADSRKAIWFAAAGVLGGLGLWIDVSIEGPVLIGLAIGGCLVEVMSRNAVSTDSSGPQPWRLWALCGAATTLFAYLIEYFPDHLREWQMWSIHPIYGVAWIGGGELLQLVAGACRRGSRPWSVSATSRAVLAVAALASLPITLLRLHTWGFLARDLTSARLSKLPGDPVGTSVWSVLVHNGISSAIVGAALPLLLVVPALWILLRAKENVHRRASIALCLGPVAVALGLAFAQLSWWSVMDSVLFVLFIAVLAAVRGDLSVSGRWLWMSGAVAVFVLSGARLQSILASPQGAVDEAEVRELIERDLAHWLVKQVGSSDILILAPANDTSSLSYYGNVRGLVTLDRDNKEGLVPAIRIASATSGQEAQELVLRRGVTHFIIPSWDSQLDDFAAAGLGTLQGSFISTLDQWALPPWLRPLAYEMPAISSQQSQRVTVLSVVDEQDDAVLFPRMAEYFIETNRLDLAASEIPALKRFPGNAGALAVLLNVQLTTGDESGAQQTLRSLLTRLSSGADRSLPWERRVSWPSSWRELSSST